MKVKELIKYEEHNDEATLEILEGMQKIIEGYYDIWNWTDDDLETLESQVSTTAATNEKIDKLKKYKFTYHEFIYDLEEIRDAIITELINENAFIKLYKQFINDYGDTHKSRLDETTNTFIKQMKKFIKDKNLEEEFHEENKHDNEMKRKYHLFDNDFNSLLIRKKYKEDEIC